MDKSLEQALHKRGNSKPNNIGKVLNFIIQEIQSKPFHTH